MNNDITNYRIGWNYWSPDRLNRYFYNVHHFDQIDKKLINLIVSGDVAGVVVRFRLKSICFDENTSIEQKQLLFAQISIILEDLARILGTHRDIGFGVLNVILGGKKTFFEPQKNLICISDTENFIHEYALFIDFYMGLHVQPSTLYDALSGGRLIIDKLEQTFKKGSARYNMNKLIKQIIFSGERQTKYYSDLKKRNSYWRRRCEIFARAFESWVSLKESRTYIGEDEVKMRNSFLHSKMNAKELYLKNSELQRVMPEMDALMKEIKRLVLE